MSTELRMTISVLGSGRTGVKHGFVTQEDELTRPLVVVQAQVRPFDGVGQERAAPAVLMISSKALLLLVTIRYAALHVLSVDEHFEEKGVRMKYAEFTKRYKVEKSFEQLLPRTESEIDALEAQIEEDGGIRDALVVWKDTSALLDGHTRLEVAKRNPDMEFTVTECDFANRDEATLWVLTNQGSRRNLSTLDKALAALKAGEILHKQAKARMRAAGGAKPGPVAGPSLDVRATLAKQFRIGPQLLSQVAYIVEHAPERIQEVRDHKVTINAFYVELTKSTRGGSVSTITVPRVGAFAERLTSELEKLTKSELVKLPRREAVLRAVGSKVHEVATAAEAVSKWFSTAVEQAKQKEEAERRQKKAERHAQREQKKTARRAKPAAKRVETRKVGRGRGKAKK
jgi:hypothetical protein